MLRDARDIGAQPVGADVCVIGAGPAGLTVAAELAEAGATVTVLEAGGSAYDRHDRSNLRKIMIDHLWGAQSLARGRNRGEPYYPLRMSRARGVGGSTNALMAHGLRARPLDPIDFRPRFDTGWPIPYTEFAEHLATAELRAGLRTPGTNPIDWAPQQPEIGSSAFDSMVAAPFRHGERQHLQRLAADLATTPQPLLVTSATVVGFDMDPGGLVTAVTAVGPGGGSFRVEAQVFVLAAGGIDNARLLLASRPALYAMDGAAASVGRNFMEHLHYVAGYLIPESPAAFAEIGRLFGDPMHPSCWLAANDDVVLDRGLLRVGIAAVPVHEQSLDPAVPAAGELARIAPYGPYGWRSRLTQAARAVRGIRQVFNAGMARLRHQPRTIYALPVMTEQPPNPESRVVLGSGSDRLGMALPELQWRVANDEFVAARRTVELLAGDVERAGLGRVTSLWDQGMQRPTVVTGGWHHMGTTAMSTSSEMGVVDRNCRVYGINNLYVAGSSVFPTSGYANPTLTLVALAARLGQHLVAKTA